MHVVQERAGLARACCSDQPALDRLAAALARRHLERAGLDRDRRALGPPRVEVAQLRLASALPVAGPRLARQLGAGEGAELSVAGGEHRRLAARNRERDDLVPASTAPQEDHRLAVVGPADRFRIGDIDVVAAELHDRTRSVVDEPEARLGVAFGDRADEGDALSVGRPRRVHHHRVLGGQPSMRAALQITDPEVEAMGRAAFAAARVGDLPAVRRNVEAEDVEGTVRSGAVPGRWRGPRGRDGSRAAAGIRCRLPCRAAAMRPRPRLACATRVAGRSVGREGPGRRSPRP